MNFVANYLSNLIDDNSENLFQVTEFYEELFDYKFPLNKMDMAAIPDFQVNYDNYYYFLATLPKVLFVNHLSGNHKSINSGIFFLN